jgi:hypothetical protein
MTMELVSSVLPTSTPPTTDLLTATSVDVVNKPLPTALDVPLALLVPSLPTTELASAASLEPILSLMELVSVSLATLDLK